MFSLTQVIFIGQCILYLPYETALSNAIEIFNEIIIYFIILLTSLLSGYLSEPLTKYNTGWVILGLTIIVVTFNWSILVF